MIDICELHITIIFVFRLLEAFVVSTFFRQPIVKEKKKRLSCRILLTLSFTLSFFFVINNVFSSSPSLILGEVLNRNENTQLIYGTHDSAAFISYIESGIHNNDQIISASRKKSYSMLRYYSTLNFFLDNLYNKKKPFIIGVEHNSNQFENLAILKSTAISVVEDDQNDNNNNIYQTCVNIQNNYLLKQQKRFDVLAHDPHQLQNNNKQTELLNHHVEPSTIELPKQVYTTPLDNNYYKTFYIDPVDEHHLLKQQQSDITINDTEIVHHIKERIFIIHSSPYYWLILYFPELYDSELFPHQYITQFLFPLPNYAMKLRLIRPISVPCQQMVSFFPKQCNSALHLTYINKSTANVKLRIDSKESISMLYFLMSEGHTGLQITPLFVHDGSLRCRIFFIPLPNAPMDDYCSSFKDTILNVSVPHRRSIQLVLVMYSLRSDVIDIDYDVDYYSVNKTISKDHDNVNEEELSAVIPNIQFNVTFQTIDQMSSVFPRNFLLNYNQSARVALITVSSRSFQNDDKDSKNDDKLITSKPYRKVMKRKKAISSTNLTSSLNTTTHNRSSCLTDSLAYLRFRFISRLEGVKYNLTVLAKHACLQPLVLIPKAKEKEIITNDTIRNSIKDNRAERTSLFLIYQYNQTWPLISHLLCKNLTTSLISLRTKQFMPSCKMTHKQLPEHPLQSHCRIQASFLSLLQSSNTSVPSSMIGWIRLHNPYPYEVTYKLQWRDHLRHHPAQQQFFFHDKLSFHTSSAPRLMEPFCFLSNLNQRDLIVTLPGYHSQIETVLFTPPSYDYNNNSFWNQRLLILNNSTQSVLQEMFWNGILVQDKSPFQNHVTSTERNISIDAAQLISDAIDAITQKQQKHPLYSQQQQVLYYNKRKSQTLSLIRLPSSLETITTTSLSFIDVSGGGEYLKNQIFLNTKNGLPVTMTNFQNILHHRFFKNMFPANCIGETLFDPLPIRDFVFSVITLEKLKEDRFQNGSSNNNNNNTMELPHYDNNNNNNSNSFVNFLFFVEIRNNINNNEILVDVKGLLDLACIIEKQQPGQQQHMQIFDDYYCQLCQPKLTAMKNNNDVTYTNSSFFNLSGLNILLLRIPLTHILFSDDYIKGTIQLQIDILARNNQDNHTTRTIIPLRFQFKENLFETIDTALMHYNTLQKHIHSNSKTLSFLQWKTQQDFSYYDEEIQNDLKSRILDMRSYSTLSQQKNYYYDNSIDETNNDSYETDNHLVESSNDRQQPRIKIVLQNKNGGVSNNNNNNNILRYKVAGKVITESHIKWNTLTQLKKAYIIIIQAILTTARKYPLLCCVYIVTFSATVYLIIHYLIMHKSVYHLIKKVRLTVLHLRKRGGIHHHYQPLSHHPRSSYIHPSSKLMLGHSLMTSSSRYRNTTVDKYNEELSRLLIKRGGGSVIHHHDLQHNIIPLFLFRILKHSWIRITLMTYKIKGILSLIVVRCIEEYESLQRYLISIITYIKAGAIQNLNLLKENHHLLFSFISTRSLFWPPTDKILEKEEEEYYQKTTHNHFYTNQNEFVESNDEHQELIESTKDTALDMLFNKIRDTNEIIDDNDDHHYRNKNYHKQEFLKKNLTYKEIIDVINKDDNIEKQLDIDTIHENDTKYLISDNVNGQNGMATKIVESQYQQCTTPSETITECSSFQKDIIIFNNSLASCTPFSNDQNYTSVLGTKPKKKRKRHNHSSSYPSQTSKAPPKSQKDLLQLEEKVHDDVPSKKTMSSIKETDAMMIHELNTSNTIMEAKVLVTSFNDPSTTANSPSSSEPAITTTPIIEPIDDTTSVLKYNDLTTSSSVNPILKPQQLQRTPLQSLILYPVTADHKKKQKVYDYDAAKNTTKKQLVKSSYELVHPSYHDAENTSAEECSNLFPCIANTPTQDSSHFTTPFNKKKTQRREQPQKQQQYINELQHKNDYGRINIFEEMTTNVTPPPTHNNNNSNTLINTRRLDELKNNEVLFNQSQLLTTIPSLLSPPNVSKEKNIHKLNFMKNKKNHTTSSDYYNTEKSDKLEETNLIEDWSESFLLFSDPQALSLSLPSNTISRVERNNDEDDRNFNFTTNNEFKPLNTFSTYPRPTTPFTFNQCRNNNNKNNSNLNFLKEPPGLTRCLPSENDINAPSTTYLQNYNKRQQILPISSSKTPSSSRIISTLSIEDSLQKQLLIENSRVAQQNFPHMIDTSASTFRENFNIPTNTDTLSNPNDTFALYSSSSRKISEPQHSSPCLEDYSHSGIMSHYCPSSTPCLQQQQQNLGNEGMYSSEENQWSLRSPLQHIRHSCKNQSNYTSQQQNVLYDDTTSSSRLCSIDPSTNGLHQETQCDSYTSFTTHLDHIFDEDPLLSAAAVSYLLGENDEFNTHPR